MPQEIVLTPITKPLSVIYTNEPYPLPEDTQKAVEMHWEMLQSSGKEFTRGDVFTIQSITDTPEKTEIKVALTDYAHYLSTLIKLPEIEKHPCRVVHTSVLIKTSDNFYAFGEMAEHTSTPKQLQCAGGGITRSDIKESNIISIEENAKNELLEETGLDCENPEHKCRFHLAYMKSGGENNFLGAMFIADTDLTSSALKTIFKANNDAISKNGSKPEFAQLLFLKANKEEIESFIQEEKRSFVDYLASWLRTEINDNQKA